MVKFISNISLLVAALSAPSASAISFSLTSASCDGSPFSNEVIDIQCGGNSNCNFGDDADVTGTLTASAFDADSEVTLEPCLMGKCYKKYAAVDGTACDWLTPSGNQACGEAGDYTVNYTVAIPSSDDVPKYLEWLSAFVKVNVIVGRDDECEANMSYAMVGLASLVAGAAAYGARRRRRASKDDKATPFVEMSGASLA